MAKTKPPTNFQSKESRRIGLLMDNAAIQKQCTNWAHEDHEKLLLLCSHYGIPEGPGRFHQLALALARELYPEPKKRGRKSKWTMLNMGALVVEVERVAKPDDPEHGVAWACTQLAKREPWASFLEAKESGTLNADPAEALRQIYFDFRGAPWANISRDAFKFHEHENTLAEWDNFVIDAVRNPHPE